LSKRSVRIGSRCNSRGIRQRHGVDADSRVRLALRQNGHSPNGHLAAPAPRVPSLGRGAWEGPRTSTRAPEHVYAVGTAVGTGLPPPLEVFCAGGKSCYLAKRTMGLEPTTLGLGSRVSGVNDQNRVRTGRDGNPHGYWDGAARSARTKRKRDRAESKRDGVEMASGRPGGQRARVEVRGPSHAPLERRTSAPARLDGCSGQE
jgi:hypothetical protein